MAEETQVVPQAPAAPAPAETQVAPAPTPVATPVAPTGPPQQTSREEIYNKYYAAQPQANVAPVPETPQTPTETPAAPAAPEAPVTPAVAPVAAPPAYDPAMIQAAVVEAMKAMMPKAPEAPQATAPVTPAPVADPNEWVQKLIAGDYTAATEALKALVMADVQSKIAPELSRTTLAEATENFKAETELNSFVNSIRESNADIIKIEPLIAPKIQYQMAEWMQSQGGKVAPLAYVEQYKKVTTAEINEARNLIQFFRATGATGQQQVKQEVLSSTTLAPSPVQAPQVPTGKPPVQTTQEYLQMRTNQTLVRNGMKLRT